MHLLLPFAAPASPAGAPALRQLRLPNLQRLLAAFTAAAGSEGDETSLNLPHERVLAELQGWHGGDGLLPFAAQWAARDGLTVSAESAWGLLTPTHWQLGREHVSLVDPAALHLGEAESRQLLQAVRELFESLGWQLHWGAPLRWYARHESLATVPTASLDRVIGRPIDAWLPARKAAAAVRRLQSEVQMLLHEHPINEQREARGELPVNAFWLSGTGVTSTLAAAAPCDVDERLRAPCLAEDWAAWIDAWQTLDGERLPQLLQRAARGEAVVLTLCGERRARRFESARRTAWQRLSGRWHTAAPPAEVLEAL